ncbi:MAG TPA: transglutaminase-like domain-containing protein [Gemmataceae bacterium]|jgi:hypothetical protein|nr:transglutaminase-like domain-containing protein [Gemmataceae bacterium]
MPYRVSSFFPVILGFLLVPAPYCWSEEPEGPALEARDIESWLRSDWYGVYLKGTKFGYYCSARERSGDFIRATETLNMKRSAFGLKSEILIREIKTFDNKAPYRLAAAEYHQRNDPAPLEKIVLVRNDKGFEYTYRTGPEVSRKQLAGIDYTLVDALAMDLWIRRGPKEADKAFFKHFDTKDAKIHTLACKVVGIKSSLVAGVNLRYFEIDNESSKDRVRFLTRHDDQGRILSNVVAIFELRLETEEQAKNTEYSQDLFLLGMVKSDRPLGPTKKVTELVIQVDGPEGEILEDGPRQSVATGPNGSRIVRLGKKHGKAVPATKKEIAEALEETNSYCIRHPKVKALAEQAVGAAVSPEDKVQRIIQFVNGFVQPTVSATMPTIHDLMDKKKGDCKSYALMVTNLARASGVPAREVYGLVYTGNDQQRFGGHVWNEVVLNGVWVPVDASLRQTEVDATHVSFGPEQKAANSLLNTLGKLSFKVVEVKSWK